MKKKILDEMPSYKKLYDDIQNMKSLFLTAGKEVSLELKEVESSITALIENAEQYNEYFSDNGWILYDSLNSKLIEKVVQEYKISDYVSAEKILIDYYKTEVGQILHQLKNGSEEFLVRYEHIKNAFEDHRSERYNASIPQFLIIADGVVNDYTKKQGFFANGTDVDAWDCLVGSTNSLQKLKEIYTQSRKKTNSNPIFLPYRNGILHGRDLNYANEFVSCKCIVLLIAIHDWIIKKNNENARKETHIKSSESISWNEVITRLNKNKEVIDKIQNWEKSEIVIGIDVPMTGASQDYDDYPYIQYLVEAFEMWQNKNYGQLAYYFDYIFKNQVNKNKRPKECRLLFQNKEFKEFALLEVEDRAIALKKIIVTVKWEMDDIIYNERLVFGLNYQNEVGEVVIPSLDEGFWVVIPWEIQGLYKF